MKKMISRNILMGLSVLWVVCTADLPGLAAEDHESASNPNNSLPASKADVEKLMRAFQESQKTIQNLQETVTRQGQVIEEMKKNQSGVTPTLSPEPGTSATHAEVEELKQKVDSVTEAQKKVHPGEFNPAIGLVGESVISYHDRNSDQTGSDRPGGFDFFQRSVELNLSASVDPFAKGYAVINASADSNTGEMTLAFEEAALQTTSLPGNLELKVGRFFADFGKQAYIHDHELPFVNRPLVLDQYIGGESKTDGLQVNWLLPTEHYVNMSAGVGDQFGENPNNPGNYRAFNELNFWTHLSTYFDLTPNWELETGVSGMFNPRTDDRGGALALPSGVALTESDRRLIGGDMKVSWVPLRNNQFQRVTWGTEVLYSDNRYVFDPDATAGSGDEFFDAVGSLGFYTYLNWKFSREWSVGAEYDWVESALDQGNRTSAYSGNLTWALSHWNQIRLQYTHTDHDIISGLPDDDAVFLQWTWIIGSHSHGWQQR